MDILPESVLSGPRSELILVDSAPGKRNLLSCPFSREVAPSLSWSVSFLSLPGLPTQRQ